MAPLPTVIRIRVIGVDLPAFLLSKNVWFRVHRNAPGSLGLAWRDLSDRFEVLGLAFQFEFRASCQFFRICKANPENPAQNKKPGVERRAQPLFPFSGSARSSTNV